MPEARLRTVKKKVPSVGVPAASTVQQAQAAVARPVLVAKTDAVKIDEIKAAAKPKVKRKPGAAIAAWWPVAIGIFLCGFVSEWQAMAEQAGVWAERLLFPLAVLMQHREMGIDAQMATVMPQWALYAQLPLEGLLTKLTLDRGRSLKFAVAQLVLLHAMCVIVLSLVSYLGR